MKELNNECSWVLLSNTEKCSKKCVDDYCSYHSYLIKQGNINRVCNVCGIGVRSTLNLCMKHGTKKRREIKNDVFNKKNNSFRSEVTRLRKIRL